VAPGHARPAETAARLRRLLAFFGANMLDDVTGALCRRYAAERSSPRIARRELEDLRAAVNHFHREGHVREVIKVVLPARGRARERWLTRSEAARLVLAAWRHRERQRGAATERFSRRHVAKFILVALYTGRRASAVTQAALRPEAGASHVDLARGLLLPGADVAARMGTAVRDRAHARSVGYHEFRVGALARQCESRVMESPDAERV